MSEPTNVDLSRDFMEPSESERDESIFHAITLGRSCEDIARNERELAFCTRMRPEIQAIIDRGGIPVTSNNPPLREDDE